MESPRTGSVPVSLHSPLIARFTLASFVLMAGCVLPDSPEAVLNRLPGPGPLETIPFAALGGGKIAFGRTVTGRSDGVYIIDADKLTWTSFTPAYVEAPSLSPDGRRVAFLDLTDFNTFRDVYVANVDGSAVRRVSSFPGNEGPPSWTPDASSVVFAATTSTPLCGVFDLYTQLPGSSTAVKTPLVSFGCPSTRADAEATQAVSISADGRVAFVCGASSAYLASALCVSNGIAVTPFYQPAQTDTAVTSVSNPSWSWDGQRMAFIAATYQSALQRWTQSLQIVEPREQRVVTVLTVGDTAGIGRPCWTADDQHLAFTIGSNVVAHVGRRKRRLGADADYVGPERQRLGRLVRSLRVDALGAVDPMLAESGRGTDGTQRRSTPAATARPAELLEPKLSVTDHPHVDRSGFVVLATVLYRSQRSRWSLCGANRSHPRPFRILLPRFALHRIARLALSADFEPARSVVLPPQDRP